MDMDKLYIKFSALNIDSDGPSLDFLGSRKSAHEGIKEQYPRKVVILPLLASLSWKRLQIGMSMLFITTSTSDKLFSRIDIDYFERLWIFKIKGFYWFLRSLAAAHTPKWTATKWREIDWQFANMNRLSRISWALAQISCSLVLQWK